MWGIYLHARQLYIETGDLDAFTRMVDHVTPADGDIPAQLDPLAWHTRTGPEVTETTSEYMRCY